METGRLVGRSFSNAESSAKDRTKGIIWAPGTAMTNVNLSVAKNSSNTESNGSRTIRVVFRDRTVIVKHVVSNGCKTINSKVAVTGKPIMALEAAIGKDVDLIACSKVSKVEITAGRVAREDKAMAHLHLHRTVPIIINPETLI